MGAFQKITISVSDDAADVMRRSIESGQYVTESEIVRDALNDWVKAREREQAKAQWLRDKLAKADEGPWFSEDEAFAQVAEALAKQHRD